MMFSYDATFGLVLLAMLIAGAAQMWVKFTFSRYSRVNARRGVTADQVARMLLDRFGLSSVAIKRISGQLTDHYDPRDKSLSLSDAVYGNASIAAIGVAAHEVGHAIQDNTAYVPLSIRNGFVPVANITSTMAMPIFFLGFLFQGPVLMEIGILLFIGVVAFHLITLPVEFNASSRAVAILRQTGALEESELKGGGSVLNAAACTYVAATVVAIMHLLRLIILSRNSSRD